MIEKILFATLVVTALMFFAIIVKYFISNDKISSLLNQKIVTKENKIFIIKVDYEYQKLTFTCRGIGKDNKPSIISNEYKFDEFIESLSIDQQIYFHEFLFKDCKEDNTKAKITINANKIFNENVDYWLRLTYLERYANNVVYIKGVKIFKRNNIKGNNNFEYLSSNSFKTKLNEKYNQVNGPVGSLFYFNFNNMEFYQKRYGVEVANDYLMQIWDELNSLFINRGFVGHLTSDKFIAFFDKKINKREIQYFVHNVINKTPFQFGIDNSIRILKPLIAIIVYGEYSNDLQVNIDYLNQTMSKLEDSTNIKYRVFDQNLFDEIRHEKEYFNNLKSTMDDQLFDPLYSPIISLNSGDTYGFFTDLDFSNLSFNSFNDVFNKSNTNSLGYDFFSKAVSKWFSSFLNNANMDVQKLFVYTSFDLIDSLINTYTSNEDYDKINLVAVITNYSDILKDPELTRRKINSLKRNGIQLGIMACPELQSVLSQDLHQFTYLVIPRQLTKDMLSNPRTNLVLQTIFDMTHDYYMDKIAVDIDNYQEAEVLKEMDVFYMSGNLFDAKKSNISMRRLTHLYDENN